MFTELPSHYGTCDRSRVPFTVESSVKDCMQVSSYLWHLLKRPLVLAPAEAAILGSGTCTLDAIFLCTRPIACTESSSITSRNLLQYLLRVDSSLACSPYIEPSLQAQASTPPVPAAEVALKALHVPLLRRHLCRDK